ncbi:hypothetical protein [Skermanella stibiiresistens]|uniref:hypothetical protein n=1 Tax=Skermanella stibiiresistens TaxID=913326 RepID=UPI0004B62F47|nr:hypothetical protein [Skermanella stibiiresistens]
MDHGSGARRVPVAMRPAGQYLIGRLLMLGERLTRERWNSFAVGADVICACALREMPVDDPASDVWDNRRGRG